jgi:hypothetical protein
LRAKISSIAASNSSGDPFPSDRPNGDARSFPISRAQNSPVTLLASGAFFFSYLIIQTVIPVYALFCDGWFSAVGWTMYTGLRPDPTFTVVYREGNRETLEQIQKRLGIGVIVGAKVDTARFVPPHLCSALPEARAVLIRDPRAATEEAYPCAR